MKDAGWYELEEMCNNEFSPLKCRHFEKNGESPSWSFGIDDEEFFQRKPDKGLITKKEIRMLSLSALKLKKNSIVWDIGTCTGSVAIEAAKIAQEGQIFAIEKNEGDLENCIQNLRKFRVILTFASWESTRRIRYISGSGCCFYWRDRQAGWRTFSDICCNRLKEWRTHCLKCCYD